MVPYCDDALKRVCMNEDSCIRILSSFFFFNQSFFLTHCYIFSLSLRSTLFHSCILSVKIKFFIYIFFNICFSELHSLFRSFSHSHTHNYTFSVSQSHTHTLTHISLISTTFVIFLSLCSPFLSHTLKCTHTSLLYTR